MLHRRPVDVGRPGRRHHGDDGAGLPAFARRWQARAQDVQKARTVEVRAFLLRCGSQMQGMLLAALETQLSCGAAETVFGAAKSETSTSVTVAMIFFMFMISILS